MLFSKRLELSKRATRWIAHNTKECNFSPLNIVTALDALGIFGEAVEHRVQRTALRMWLAISVSVNIGLLIVLAIEIGTANAVR